MNRSPDPLSLPAPANDISPVCRPNDILRCYNIYYITRSPGMTSPRVLLLRNTGCLGTGAIELIFSHAWRG
jgi:hypothetical protein